MTETVTTAVGYRVVNTLDNMIGHHGKYEYTGKFAARLDDVANFGGVVRREVERIRPSGDDAPGHVPA